MISNVTFPCIWCFTALIFSIQFGSIECNDALLFDIKKNILVQKPLMPDDKSEITCENCALACPAFKPEDLEHNYKKSFGKKVLFLKFVYYESKKLNEIEVPECEQIVQPSIVLNTTKGQLETGYEIHDRENTIEFLLPNRSPDGLLSLYPSDSEKEPDPKNVFLKYLKSKNKMSQSEENFKDFIWLPVLSISFNIHTLSPVQIEYHPDLGPNWWRENCNAFDIGKEFYPENSITSFYSPENQKKIFTGVESQSDELSVDKPESSEEEFECGQKYGCLVQHQIIPSYYFNSYYGALATCAPMNTAPVWKSIVNRIKLVDRYLYAITQLWQPNVHIINRFFGAFIPSSDDFEQIPKPGLALFLDQRNRNILVPRIIYKIIEYKITSTLHHNNVEISDHYFAIIVIHNDPTPNSEATRMCHESSTISGWEVIENEELASGLIYVCPLNKYVAYQLNIPGKETMRDRFGLKLNELPKYDIENDTFVYYDARSEIEEKFKQLFEIETLS